jgi:hypothetical protein
MQQCLTRPWTMAPNLHFSLFLSHSPSMLYEAMLLLKQKKNKGLVHG